MKRDECILIIDLAPYQSHMQYLTCVQETHITSEIAPYAQCYLFIEHQAGNIDCTLTLAKGSKAELVFVGNKPAASNVNMRVILADRNAHAVISGIYALADTAVLSFDTQQMHKAAHTTSALHMRKIVRDAAKAQYHGMIELSQESRYADASQNDITLLIGNDARAESVPSIEVKTNDVKCAHGSAIGRLDMHQMHYMQTRGLDTIKAETLLLNGFFIPAIDNIGYEEFRHRALACMGIHYE